MTIDIIGAGIGGLTTAIALKQKGLSVRVFEQAEHIKPVGAGIILANNAMQVYEKLGLQKEIEANGNPISSLKITKPNLKCLSKVDLTYFEEKSNIEIIAIHRGKLQQILLRKLKSSEVFLGRKLSKIEMRTNGCQLEFTNGETLMSSMVLGADGLHSTVRNQLFPNNTIRNAKQICWRGIANYNLPEEFQHELNEAWGSLIRFGFVQIAPKKVYWYALQSFTKSAADFSVAHLIDYFLDYNDVVKEIIKSTNTSQIHKAEILDLKPTNKWFSNNICLLGDAAHATTPNLGQGACQAIEDAFVLSECLAKYDDTSKAFEEFQKLRIVKAHQVVKTSWTVGKIAHVKNPILAGLRNQILKLTPSSFSRKQNEFIFKLAEL